MESHGMIVARMIGMAIEIALYIAFLVYLDRLERTGCKCAMDWKRNVLIVYIVFMFAWKIATIFAPKLMYNVVLNTILVGLRIMFIVLAVQYINKLKKDKCDCSSHLTREVLYYYAWISIILLIVSIVFMFWLIVTLRSIMDTPYKNNKTYAKKYSGKKYM
jgi:hypothetical protein